MAIEILEDGRISDSFEMGEGALLYKDAIVMLPKAYEALTAEEIAVMKQARYDNWLAIIQAPPIAAPEEVPQDG